jgi:hypothetical protein
MDIIGRHVSELSGYAPAVPTILARRTHLDFLWPDEHVSHVNARGGSSCSHLRSSAAFESESPS